LLRHDIGNRRGFGFADPLPSRFQQNDFWRDKKLRDLRRIRMDSAAPEMFRTPTSLVRRHGWRRPTIHEFF
jgi:hypothetical protein